MVCHANGLSLFDGLYVGGQKGQFNIDMLVSIKQLKIDARMASNAAAKAGAERAVALHQLHVSNKWLSRHGLKLQRLRPVQLEFKDASDDSVRVFMDCIADRGRYQSIMIYNGRRGHSVATYTAENGEIRFFDPNYGDFSFLTHGSFKRWFEQQFWPLSYEGRVSKIGALSYTATYAS